MIRDDLDVPYAGAGVDSRGVSAPVESCLCTRLLPLVPRLRRFLEVREAYRRSRSPFAMAAESRSAGESDDLLEAVAREVVFD